MIYAVSIERRAQREIVKLSEPALSRIAKAIDGLVTQPRPSGCKKLAGSRSEWRIRVGDYRILYEIDDRARCVQIFAVGHLGDVYRS